MENENSIIILIIAMMVVTYLPRMIPMVFLAGKKIPDWLNEWLGYIPVTVLAALLFPTLFMKDQQIFISGNSYLLAALPTFIAGFLTKNIFVTVIVGMISIVLIRLYVFPI